MAMERAESPANDFGLLLLRLSIGGLMLFHGVNKIQNGVEDIENKLIANEFPKEMAYGVYAGEVAAPILILLGLFTRFAAIGVAATMGMAVYLAHREQIFDLNPMSGSPVIELNALYFLGALALVFTGPGRFGISGGRGWWG